MQTVEELAETVVDSITGNIAQDRPLTMQANRAYRELAEDVLLLTATDGKAQFLLTYTQEERQKYQADSLDAVPYDELREEPLCYCDDSHCTIKQGRLPPQARKDGIRAFSQDHGDYPVVLHEADAEWRSKEADVRDELRRIVVSMRTNTPLDDLDMPGEQDAAATNETERATATDD